MFDKNELEVLRSSLNTIDIKGSNAQYLAKLQIKIEQEILRIEEEIKLGPPELRNKKVDEKSTKNHNK